MVKLVDSCVGSFLLVNLDFLIVDIDSHESVSRDGRVSWLGNPRRRGYVALGASWDLSEQSPIIIM